MKNELLRKMMVAGILLATSMSATAANFGFMKNSPISRFDDDDLEVFQSSVINALDNARDGQVIRWESPGSGYSGQIFILSTDDSGENVCRKMRLMNVAGNLNSNVHYNACRDDIAGWQIVPAQDPPPQADSQAE